MLKAVLTLVVSLTLVGALVAQDNAQRTRNRGQRGGRSMLDRVLNMKDLNLTEDQTTKIKDLKKEYDPKMKEAMEKAQGNLTAEQKKAREDAVKAARDAGKTGRDLMQAGKDAVKLTEEQKTAQTEGRKAMRALQKEIMEKVQSLLTDPQKETLKKALEARGGGRGGRAPRATN